MVVKKILQNAFEQIVDTGKDMAKSSAKQVVETLSPWEMIRNSFNTEEGQHSQVEPQEKKKEGKNNTSLDLKNLQKEYAKQDDQKIKQMSDRLFHLVNNNSEKVSREKENNKVTQERNQLYKSSEKQREEQERRKRLVNSDVPKGKERGTALGGKKKHSSSTPEPLEFRPANGR